jgi:hypothetical protein
LSNKFTAIPSEERDTRQLMEAIASKNQGVDTATLDSPITMVKLEWAIRKGPRHRAPGIDGLGLEFYKLN